MKKLSVAVLLSGREQFSVYYGGALARWTYEVYSRLRDEIDVKVFGAPVPGLLQVLRHQPSQNAYYIAHTNGRSCRQDRHYQSSCPHHSTVLRNPPIKSDEHQGNDRDSEARKTPAGPVGIVIRIQTEHEWYHE